MERSWTKRYFPDRLACLRQNGNGKAGKAFKALVFEFYLHEIEVVDLDVLSFRLEN